MKQQTMFVSILKAWECFVTIRLKNTSQIIAPFLRECRAATQSRVSSLTVVSTWSIGVLLYFFWHFKLGLHMRQEFSSAYVLELKKMRTHKSEIAWDNTIFWFPSVCHQFLFFLCAESSSSSPSSSVAYFSWLTNLIPVPILRLDLPKRESVCFSSIKVLALIDNPSSIEQRRRMSSSSSVTLMITRFVLSNALFLQN